MSAVLRDKRIAIGIEKGIGIWQISVLISVKKSAG